MRMSCNSQGYPQIQPADGELFQRVLGTLTGGLLGVLLIVRLWAEALPLPRRHVGSFDLAPRTGTRRPLGLRRNPLISLQRESHPFRQQNTPFQLRQQHLHRKVRTIWPSVTGRKQQVSIAMHCVQRR